MRAGALAATAVIGAGLLGAAPAASAAGPAGPAGTVHYDVALADLSGTTTPTPTFDDSLKFLLDSFGIGQKTLPQIFAGSGTVGDLLGASGLSVSTPLDTAGLFGALGLNNYTVGDILTDLGLNPATMSMDDVAAKFQMANVPVDFFATPLGMPSTETTLGLAHRFSVAHLTLDQMLQRVGFSGNETLSQSVTQMNLQGSYINTLLGIGGLIGNMTCPVAVSGNMTLDQFINCLTFDGTEPNGTGANTHGSVHLTGNTTIEQILTQQHFYTTDALSNHTSRIIGSWTLGEIFNFNSTTTIKQFIDNLHVNFGPVVSLGNGVDVTTLPTLGSKSLADFLTWINLAPNQTVANLLSNEIIIGGQPLNQFTIQDALNHLMLNPLAIGTSGSEVEDSTPLVDFLTGLGGPMATETLDQLWNLS